MAIEGILTSVLLTTLRANDVGVLAAEMHVLDVPLQTHLVEVLIAMRTSLARIAVLLRRSRRSHGVGVVLRSGGCKRRGRTRRSGRRRR